MKTKTLFPFFLLFMVALFGSGYFISEKLSAQENMYCDGKEKKYCGKIFFRFYQIYPENFNENDRRVYDMLIQLGKFKHQGANSFIDCSKDDEVGVFSLYMTENGNHRLRVRETDTIKNDSTTRKIKIKLHDSGWNDESENGLVKPGITTNFKPEPFSDGTYFWCSQATDGGGLTSGIGNKPFAMPFFK